MSNNNTQWHEAVENIDQLVQDHETGHSTVVSTSITKRHWIPSNLITKCQGCQLTKFSLTERHHHCRRCGGLFCKKCTSYSRRLSILARPDPNGKLYKVCQACFEEGPQTIGFYKNWAETFKYFKAGGAVQNGAHPPEVKLREKFNYVKECERLKKGYQESIASVGSLKRTLSEIQSMVTIPDWQKASNYVLDALSVRCSSCRKEFKLTRSKYQCTVCGTAICSECSCKDLIVYIPNSGPQDAKLAIIKIVGCPEEEPSKCMYLRACISCKDRLEQDQIEMYKKLREAEEMCSQMEELEDVEENINSINTQLRKIQMKIDDTLPKYQELVEVLDVGFGPKKSSGPSTQSNIQVLAKAQGDLADQFSELVLIIGNVKKLNPQTRTQTSVLKNIIKSKCTYYQENMFTFRELKRRLQEITPPEVLQSIQDIVDRNAINSSYISIKQLLYESMHLCSSYSIADDIVQKLFQVERAIEHDLRVALKRAGEDWEHHEACVNELLQVQLKNHRLIKTSRRLTKKHGASHIREVLFKRSLSVVHQVLLQLSSKSADSSYKASKEKLQDHKAALLELNQPEHDWEIT